MTGVPSPSLLFGLGFRGLPAERKGVRAETGHVGMPQTSWMCMGTAMSHATNTSNTQGF